MRISKRQAIIGAVVILALLIAVVGHGLWYYLLRQAPDTVYAAPEEHFKYAAIGLSVDRRVPYYIWKVLPTICADQLPQPRGFASFGFIFEEGRDIPVGFSLRTTGFPALEANCGLCHTGAYRTSPTAKPQVIVGAPAYELDLHAFQKFLYACATNPNFTPDGVLAEIQRMQALSPIESLIYRFVIIPSTRQGLLDQRKAFDWLYADFRPPAGPGRVDTFGANKFMVFQLPEDGTIGIADIPPVWNQAPRQGIWLHWDGNNDRIEQRNFSAAMSVGAKPETILLPSLDRATGYLLQLPPPPFPFEIDQTLAETGKAIYAQACAACHDFDGAQVGQVVPIAEIGTDPHRLDSFTQPLVEKFHAFNGPPFVFTAFRKTNGYVNLPLDGVWARAPYLHNGSVPTLWDLLQPEADRPKVFHRGYNVYDSVNVGFVSEGSEAEQAGFRFDTSVPGNANSGHLYGTDLSSEEKRALLEYLKTK